MEFSHRCAAITVRRARRRRRLHNDVGHIAGEISALLDQLKNRKQWSSAQLSVCVRAYVLCDNYLLTGISVSSFSLSKHFMSSGGEYLVVGQDHGLGVVELLLDIMQGCRIIALGSGVIKCHRAQGVRGGGTLHALQGQTFRRVVKGWNIQPKERAICWTIILFFSHL